MNERLIGLTRLLPFARPYLPQVSLAALFLLLAASSTLAIPLALRTLIDAGFSADNAVERIGAMRGHFGALFAIAVALGSFTALRYYMVSWLGERIVADVRKAVYSRVLEQSPLFFETTRTGEVLSRLTADATLVQTVVGSSLSMGLRSAILFTGGLAILIVTNPRVSLTAIAITAVFVLPAIVIGRRVRRLSRASQDRVADSSAIATEILNAVGVVQSFVQEDRERSRFDAATERAFTAAIRRSRVRASLTAFVIIALFGSLVFGMQTGVAAVIEGKLEAGVLGQSILYIGIVASSAAVLAEVWGEMLRAAGATERMMELLATEPSIRSPERPHVRPPSDAGSAVQFSSVRFHYPSRPAVPALADLDLSVAPGETVALVGPSGAGKSTVFQLLQRFYEPEAGEIRVDGVPIGRLALHDLRAGIAVVPQEPVIFSASAADNIRYGRPEASDDEVIAAARAAQADGFIRALPQGYDTFLGERGVRLSGGQRQRLAIARAILKDAPLLLLDEATSALDAESERLVQQALRSAMRGRSTLVIAHRLATVQHVSRIVVMDHGRVVESGTHGELVARGGLYARLAELQFEGV